MPWGRKRCQQTRNLHFITFSCYQRQPLLNSFCEKRLFEPALEQTRGQLKSDHGAMRKCWRIPGLKPGVIPGSRVLAVGTHDPPATHGFPVQQHPPVRQSCEPTLPKQPHSRTRRSIHELLMQERAPYAKSGAALERRWLHRRFAYQFLVSFCCRTGTVLPRTLLLLNTNEE